MYACTAYNAAMKRTSLFLPEPMLKQLRDMSEARGVPVAELVRRAVELFLAKEAKR